MNSSILYIIHFSSETYKRRLFSILLGLGCLSYISGQSIIIDHRHVEDFDRIPALYKEKAEQTRMLFMDRSVGANISAALDCLASDWAVARSYCKRWEHRDTTYNVEPKEVFWSGIWDRSAWRYEFWPTNCSEDVSCFVEFMEPRMDSFDVMGCQFSYLAVLPGAIVADPVRGFFGSTPGKNHANILVNFSNKYPDKKIIWWTTSLARSIGTMESQQFNDQMREYARSHSIILFDVADILSHDPSGKPCFDNRDGVQYADENNADDHLDIPAICPQYTTETEGGHLGSISAGGIRVAKAFWVLMATLSGWDGITTTKESFSEDRITIFPNPGNNYVMIRNYQENDPIQEISILDIHGVRQKHWQMKIPYQRDIELFLDHMASGVYIIVIKRKNTSAQKMYMHQRH